MNAVEEVIWAKQRFICLTNKQYREQESLSSESQWVLTSAGGIGFNKVEISVCIKCDAKIASMGNCHVSEEASANCTDLFIPIQFPLKHRISVAVYKEVL